MPVANEEAMEWLHQFHAAGDALRPEHWIPKFFAKDSVMNFASNPPVKGQDNILAVMNSQCGYLQSMKHVVDHVDVVGDRIYQDCIIEYVVKGDPEAAVIPVKGFAVFHKQPDEQTMYRFDVYGDFTPLVEKIGLVAKQSI